MSRRKKEPTAIELLRQKYARFKKGESVAREDTSTAPCYVCQQRSPKKVMTRIGGVDGVNVYRHKHCVAGSRSWLRHCSDSQWHQYFQGVEACPEHRGEQEDGED